MLKFHFLIITTVLLHRARDKSSCTLRNYFEPCKINTDLSVAFLHVTCDVRTTLKNSRTFGLDIVSSKLCGVTGRSSAPASDGSFPFSVSVPMLSLGALN